MRARWGFLFDGLISFKTRPIVVHEGSIAGFAVSGVKPESIASFLCMVAQFVIIMNYCSADLQLPGRCLVTYHLCCQLVAGEQM